MCAGTSKDSDSASLSPAAHRLKTQRQAMVWRIQKMTFWVLYDHLGHFIVLNLLTMLPLAALLWLSQNSPISSAMLNLVAIVIYTSVVTAGQLNLVNVLLSGGAFEYRHLWNGMGRFGLATLLLGVIAALALVVCGVGLWFYGGVLAFTYPMPGIILAQCCASALALLLMAVFFALPSLPSRSVGTLGALRIGLALVAGHPVVSLGLLITVCIYAVFMITPPGAALLSTVPLVVLASCAYELLARYHGGDQDIREDEEDDYLNRGFRDFLFPWKG